MNTAKKVLEVAYISFCADEVDRYNKEVNELKREMGIGNLPDVYNKGGQKDTKKSLNLVT